MATSTTVDTMIIVAVLMTMLTPTIARPVRAPMLITPATKQRPRVEDEGFGKSSTCARGRRATAARVVLFVMYCAPPARAQGRAHARSACDARKARAH
eukprot:1690945-Pyramimonas_sp.AAC.1